VLPALALMGPTASGKSAVAAALAEQIEVEIISVDSAQCYRGMDLGTAKPSADERARVPHHLIDTLDPEQSYSAGAFRRDALGLMGAIRARGRTPLLVGGTMLYFKALMHGIAELPPADAALRGRIHAEAARSGWPALHQRLAALDPASAARIDANDRQRIQRALELIELTGRKLDELHAATAADAPQIAAFALVPEDRSELHRRIGLRLDAMFEAGLVDEVRALRARTGLSADSPAMRAVGYRQVWAHLDGAGDLATTREQAAAATRNLAKRQLTWLNGFPEAGALRTRDADTAQGMASLILGIVGA